MRLVFHLDAIYSPTPKEEEETEYQPNHSGTEDEEAPPKNKKMSRRERKYLEEKQRQERAEAYRKENNKRCVHPVDLWFLLGEHIRPEQVKAFSLICRAASHVIRTKRFWLSLYRR